MTSTAETKQTGVGHTAEQVEATLCDDGSWMINTPGDIVVVDRGLSAIDAARIALTWNCHDDLLGALQNAEEWLSGWASAEPYLTTIRAALSRAEGRTT